MTCRNWNENFRDKSTEQCWAILEESTRNTSIERIPKFAMGGKARKARSFSTNTKTITAVKRQSEAYISYTVRPEMNSTILNIEELQTESR